MTVKVGDIVRSTAHRNAKNCKVIHVYKDEPKMVLMTPVDEWLATPSCLHALLIDLELVEEGDGEETTFVRTQAPKRTTTGGITR